MADLKIYKVNSLPATLVANAVYFVKNGAAVNMYVTDSAANAIALGQTGLATVATSGSYTDLINKPTIPTNNNQLTNGAGYITGFTETDPTISVYPAKLSGNSLDWNTVAWDASKKVYIDQIAVPNYTGQANYPFSGYGTLLAFGRETLFSAQIAIQADGNRTIAYRSSYNSDTFTDAWVYFLTSNSFNSYAPSLTGAGASGTWGIGITGNAETVTNGLYSTGNYADPSWLTSLAYSKLTGAPAIPTNNNQLTNGAGYITGYSETDTLQTVCNRGTSTTTTITANAFYESSSRELKKEIKDFTKKATDLLLGISVKEFKFKNSETKHVGIIAEDTDEVFSTQEKNKFDIASTVGVLIKGFQELLARIEKLEGGLV